MRRCNVLSTILILAATTVAGPAAAQTMGRVAGTAVDSDGKPLEGVTVTVTSPDLATFQSVKTTDRKGKFTVAHPDVTLSYVYTFEKAGLATLELPVRVSGGATMRQTFTLLRSEEVAAAQEPQAAALEGQRVSRVVEVYNQGAEAQQLGDLELAADRYREAARLAPNLAAPRASLAAVALIQEDWATAAAEAEAALQLDPSDVRAMQIRFDAYRHLGDEAMVKKAADALRAVGDLRDAATRLYNEAVDAHNAGNVAEAQSKLQQVVQLDPDLVAAHVALARIALRQGSPATAAQAATEATRREPDRADAWILLFDSSRLAGNQEVAEKALDRVAELAPEWVATTLFEHAVALYNDGALEQAVVELERVVRVAPDQARAHYLYGMALYNLGRTAEAKTALEEFLARAGDDPEAAVARDMLSYLK